MGDGAVVLPVAVDEIVGKRRDGRDRLCTAETTNSSTLQHRPPARKDRPRRRNIVSFAAPVAGVPVPSSCDRRTQYSSESRSFFFIDRARERMVQVAWRIGSRGRKARIASLMLVYQRNLCLA